jgi:hypothetical protein
MSAIVEERKSTEASASVKAADELWGPCLKDINWRMDMPADKEKLGELGEPVALVELKTGKKGPSDPTSSVQFQMTKGQLSDLLGELNKIKDLIESARKGPEEDTAEDEEATEA